LQARAGRPRKAGRRKGAAAKEARDRLTEAGQCR
jgi:hypothetical protein